MQARHSGNPLLEKLRKSQSASGRERRRRVLGLFRSGPQMASHDERQRFSRRVRQARGHCDLRLSGVGLATTLLSTKRLGDFPYHVRDRVSAVRGRGDGDVHDDERPGTVRWWGADDDASSRSRCEPRDDASAEGGDSCCDLRVTSGFPGSFRDHVCRPGGRRDPRVAERFTSSRGWLLYKLC